MNLIQIDETDGGTYFYLLTKPIGDDQTLCVHLDEDAGVNLIYTMPNRVLQNIPKIEMMDWNELLAAGFVER